MNNIPCGNTEAEIDRDHEPKHAIDRSRENERERSLTIEEINYSNIVYQNTVAGLLSGAELIARDGKTKWSLSQIDTSEMTMAQIQLEARVMASYVVG